MNPSSCTQSPPHLDDEPIRIRDYAKAAVLVTAACASIAITFTAIAAGYAVDGAIKRIFRKGGRHVPR
jgi:hypothetical protein